MMKRDINSWLIQVPGWLLLFYLVYAQATPAFNYETGVAMVPQEPAEVVSAVGVAFWYSFAFADLVTYIPILGMAGYIQSEDVLQETLELLLSLRLTL